MPLQQAPEGQGVGLDAVRAADHQHGAVQDLQGPLHLRGEVHMARGVQEGHLHVPRRVQKGVPVVHPPQPPDTAGGVQQGLREGGLPRVHMGQHAQH